MADAETLKNEIMRLEAEAKTRRDEASRSAMRASGDRAVNDDASAAADESRANALNREADQREAQAKQLESQLTDTLLQLENLRRKKSELEAKYKQEMDEIDRQINRLAGGTGSFSTPIPSIF